VNGALSPYRALSEATASVPIAAGEGCNNFVQAQAMIDHAGIRYIQIDAGRIGGITVAKRVADYAKQNGVHYVNHTFTSNLALSASLQPYAGIEESFISEFPVELKQLAIDIGEAKITRDADGYIHVPEESGLGVTVNFQKLKKYLVDVEIRVGGKVVYATPEE
jgi:L-alanine-DL-glutamate epimerase-like enolase superfamily enzyme